MLPKNILGLRGLIPPQYKYKNFVGYIYMPIDISFDIYQKKCYDNGVISVLTNDGEFLKEVLIPKHLLNDLELPINSNVLGSLVYGIYLDKSCLPIINGILFKQNETNNHYNEEYLLEKIKNNNKTSIRGNSEEVIIESKGLISKILIKSDDKILLKSKTTNEEFEIENKNILNSYSLKLENKLVNQDWYAYLDFIVGEGLKYIDSNKNEILINEEGIILKSDIKIINNNGEEPAVLGNKLNDNLKEVITQLNNLLDNLINIGQTDLVMATSLGLTYATQLNLLEVIKTKLEIIDLDTNLSQKSFLE